MLDDSDWSFLIKTGIVILVAYLGVKAPELFLTNSITKRQQSMRIAFPDALDLMLICVESGMSIEHAFRKVGNEIGAALRAARRGVRAGDGRALLSAGSAPGLSQSLGAHRASIA